MKPADYGFSGRDQILSALGYKRYSDYLLSETWKSIRSRVWRRQDGLCRCCGLKMECVHHFGYTMENMSGKRLSLLADLCFRCHDVAHTKVVDMDGLIKLVSAKMKQVKRSKKRVKHRRHTGTR